MTHRSRKYRTAIAVGAGTFVVSSAVTLLLIDLVGRLINSTYGPEFDLDFVLALPGLLVIAALFIGCFILGLFVFDRLRPPPAGSDGRCPTCDYDVRGDLDNGCPECVFASSSTTCSAAKAAFGAPGAR